MAQQPRIYSVSQVNTLIKSVLENNLPGRMAITGEITDFKHHSSGHSYFSLKDESSALPCVMWKSKFCKVKFEVENGLAVVARGHIDVYPPQGKYQFYVDAMKPAGVGELQLAFEQMVKRLEGEGLFDEKYKRPLPKYPQRIGIVTSESGAAVHDIVDSIFGRWSCAKLFLYPVAVQGEGAADEIAGALRDVNRRNEKLGLDLLIVGRGGGSLEDLWAFNEEVLARAIFDSSIPVISAVGHEVDTTIADLVADARASTPTKAGVVAVPDMKDVLEQLAVIESRLCVKVQGRMELARQRIETVLASSVFRNPLLPVNNRRQQLDELESMLSDSFRAMVFGIRNRLGYYHEQVSRIEPHRLIGSRAIELTELSNRARSGVSAILERSRISLVGSENRLGALNPRSVLKRGYSITTNKKTGVVVRRPEDIEIGDLLETELAEEKKIESKVVKR
jgi:exodeoxyribonuclease VII large subunit